MLTPSRRNRRRIIALTVGMLLVSLAVLGLLIWQIAAGRWNWSSTLKPDPAPSSVSSVSVTE